MVHICDPRLLLALMRGQKLICGMGQHGGIGQPVRHKQRPRIAPNFFGGL